MRLSKPHWFGSSWRSHCATTPFPTCSTASWSTTSTPFGCRPPVDAYSAMPASTTGLRMPSSGAHHLKGEVDVSVVLVLAVVESEHLLQHRSNTGEGRSASLLQIVGFLCLSRMLWCAKIWQEEGRRATQDLGLMSLELMVCRFWQELEERGTSMMRLFLCRECDLMVTRFRKQKKKMPEESVKSKTHF